MGTNYYHRTNVCSCCGRYDEHHIGKSSGGWTFGFHGEREKDPDINPLGVVVSFAEWKDRLKEGKIFNEYGEEVSLEDFLQLVESKRNGNINHTEYCRINHPEERCWLDDDGNSFSEGEFS